MPPTNEGKAGVYIGATGHRPLPKYDGRRPHHDHKPKPTGLDWDAIRATQPQQPTVEPAALTWPCKTCGEHSSDLVDGLCPLCVAEAAAKFTVPTAVPEPPTEGKQGKPATGSSAPGATQASSTTGRAPVAGPSTHQGKNPEAAQETRPVAASGPTVHTVESFNADVDRTVGLSTTGAADQLDNLIDAIAQVRATAATELARIENALEEIRKSLLPASGFEVFQRRAVVTEKRREAARQPRPSRRGSRTADVDLAKAKELLAAGRSCPQIARELGVGVKAVRNALDRAGIQRIDGRTTHSGGKLRDLKARIASLSVTSRDIKTWALDQGLITEIRRGIAPTPLVDAYENAHPRTSTSISDQSGALSA